MCLELAPGYGERVDRGGWKLEMKIMITDKTLENLICHSLFFASWNSQILLLRPLKKTDWNIHCLDHVRK